jgi:hypothetical protein
MLAWYVLSMGGYSATVAGLAELIDTFSPLVFWRSDRSFHRRDLVLDLVTAHQRC